MFKAYALDELNTLRKKLQTATGDREMTDKATIAAMQRNATAMGTFLRQKNED